MTKIVQADEVEYEEVEWGLTKELIAPQIVGSTKVKINITEYLPGHTHKLHAYPNQEEVIFVLSGKGITEIQGERREIGPGSVVFVPAGELHTTSNLSQSESLKAVIIKAPPNDEKVQV